MGNAVIYEVEDRTARIALNEPAIHNALGQDLVVGLLGALERAAGSDEVRVVVLTGVGPTFCAGLNLKGDFGGFVQKDDAPSPYQTLVKTFWDCPKPVIARVQGSAFGAGFGLILCCDIAIAAAPAEFAVTELHFGMPPTLIPLMLRHKQLLGALRPLLYTGERFGARRALELHVIHEIAEQATLDDAVSRCRDRLLRCAPEAFTAAKAIQRSIGRMAFAEGLEFAAEELSRGLSSDEAREGFAAFAEKRRPKWAG
jgi:methylglutaconyl-CoA hydratase